MDVTALDKRENSLRKVTFGRLLSPQNTDFIQLWKQPEMLNGTRRKGELTPASKYEPPHKFLVGNKGEQQQGLQVDPFDEKPEEIG